MRSGLKFSLIPAILSLLVAAESCYCYKTVRLSRKVGMVFVTPDKPVPADRVGTAGKGGKSASREGRQRVYVHKKLILVWFGDPADKINNMGAEYALKGEFKEAEMLFRDALKENPNCAAACGNLGLVYEIFGNRKAAFEMYSRACLLEPGNPVFRENFLYTEYVTSDKK